MTKAEKRTLHHSTFLVGYWIFGNCKIATVSKARGDAHIVEAS
jgi:hypothetical protein